MTGSRNLPVDVDADESLVEEQAERVVQNIVRLAMSDEACKILGVDGTLEDEVDVMFAVDPIGYVANEIAGALAVDHSDEDAHEHLALSALVALVRLYQTTTDGFIDEAGLRDAVIDRLTGEDDDDEDDDYE